MANEKPVSKENLLDKAKKRFRLAQQAEEDQRKREKDDLRFQIPEEQWDKLVREERKGRPCLSISKIDQPIQLVLNQERSAKLGVSIQPLSPEAGVEVATILEGLYRRIERDSQAEVARSWAFDRAVKCGRGVYRVNTKYDESSEGFPNDQVITIERILHQDSVYFDPSATKADFSDGEYAFVATWMSIATFKREFPDAKSIPEAELEFEGLEAESPEWVRGEGENRAVRVVEYFYKKHTTEDVGPKDKTRKKDVVSVNVAKLTGFEVLDDVDRKSVV